MGWVPTLPPAGAMTSPPPVSARTGWGPPPGGAPRGAKGLSFRYNLQGHYITEYPVALAHMNVTIPFAAPQHPSTMYYGNGWLQETPYGSCGFTSARASPPQPSSSPSPDLVNNGSYAPTFHPHLVAEQFARQGKAGSQDFTGVDEREEWVANFGCYCSCDG